MLGSRVVIRNCAAKGVEHCVVVSTDKAVRFGNVLGSAGSVLPLIKAQIAAGGPVTVTHPEVTRFFMTIPEACSLILQAGGSGHDSEIFVLKMGTPVKIDNMARDMITLSGFVPDREIEVRYTGLRPGEKLYEELITEGEDVIPTGHADIMVLKPCTCQPREVLDDHIDTLVALALKRDANGLKTALNQAVPEYRPQLEGSPAQQDTAEEPFDEAQMRALAN